MIGEDRREGGGHAVLKVAATEDADGFVTGCWKAEGKNVGAGRSIVQASVARPFRGLADSSLPESDRESELFGT